MSIIKSVAECACGLEFIIESGDQNSFRRDGKRVYPVECGHLHENYFRCPQCGACVHECVPGAEYTEVES